VAAGGGFEIALACDIVIAADTARFGLPEPRVGLIAGAGGIHRLTRQIPLKHAMGMLLTGRLVSAEEGHRLGFVNEVVPAADLTAAADRWASQILECSPLLLRLTKESARDGFGRPVDEAIARDWEQRLPRLLASQDYVEGPRAFAEKRKPVWTGR
jgi:enoyl-CoA hydratase/carnithine racemase